MAYDSLQIAIAGTEAADIYPDLLSLEVELDEELAGMFRLTVALQLHADGSWSYLDDDRLVPWQRVVITAGLASDTEQLLSGYITHLRPCFTDGLDQCQLEIWGMDASVLMDRDDVLRDWPNKKDSDIAQEVFQSYRLTPQVTDTGVIHDEAVSTIIQRETDIRFLRRLALRNGYECFVDGATGYFQPPAVDGSPQPVLAVQFGDQTTVTRFALEVNALAPSNVTMFQVDRLNKQVLDASADSLALRQLGAKPISSFLAGDMTPGQVYLGQAVTTGLPEMTALCQELYDRSNWFVTGEGEVDANGYGNVLKPRGIVLIKGVGETHSGMYYISHVTHSFTADGYTQRFTVKRNALAPTGSENFAAGTGLLPGSPV
jgi:hypothetical protein